AGYCDQGVKVFAEKSGKTEQRIRHLIAKSPDSDTAKNIGNAAAREFERVLGLEKGWLDIPHTELWGTESRHQISQASNVSNTISQLSGEVPLISWVQAGVFCEAHDLFEPGDAEDWLARPRSAGPLTYALRVVGDSMTSPYPGSRSYPDGVIIYVDPDKEVLSGSRGIFKLPNSNEVTFKELVSDAGTLYLKPINPQFDKILVTSDMTCCGRVIGSYMPE
ncbi:MAG: S24 family peptidase, partial [Gammaproteobacteria bacterium]|nr:S24 family peptidase [Gammaproteobacteria bacterium]